MTENLAQSTDEFNQRYHALGLNLAFVGTSVSIPLKPADQQPEDERMRTDIALHGYEVVQSVPPPWTHLIAVNYHLVEPSPQSYFLVELPEHALEPAAE